MIIKKTGAAWLSAVRVVKCLVKSYNGRNPFEIFHLLFRNAHEKWEEGGDHVKSSWPLWVGLQR